MPQTTRISKNNTSIVWAHDDGMVLVCLHGTDIVRIYPIGTICLHNGGHFTATTKTRMNQVSHQWGLGFGVYQKDGKWFVSFGHYDERLGDWVEDKPGTAYCNGMTFTTYITPRIASVGIREMDFSFTGRGSLS